MTATDTSNSSYVLNRNWSSSARLFSQHALLKLREGWLVHPVIRSAVTPQAETTSLEAKPSPLRIADIAAGNCIWSLDVLLSELPDAKITAFDVSAETFPPSYARHPNLDVQIWDIFNPPPKEYESYFDIVHARFLLGVLHTGGHEKVVKHLSAMLKPGGWIQWQDAPPPSIGPINPETLEPVPKTEWPPAITLMDELEGIWANTKWINDLDVIFRDIGGLTNTKLERPSVMRETLKTENDLTPWLYEELLKALPSDAEDEGLKTKKKALLKAMDEEWDLIAKGDRCWSYRIVVALGMKPKAE